MSKRKKTVLDDFVLGCATKAAGMATNGLCMTRTINKREECIICIIGIGERAEALAKVIENESQKQ